MQVSRCLAREKAKENNKNRERKKMTWNPQTNTWATLAEEARSIGSSRIPKVSSECQRLPTAAEEWGEGIGGFFSFLTFLGEKIFCLGREKMRGARKTIREGSDKWLVNMMNEMKEWMNERNKRRKEKGIYHVASRLVMEINMDCDDTVLVCSLLHIRGNVFELFTASATMASVR